jgi:hypothetical protein
MSSQNIITNNYRFQFVEKQENEVGDGTPYDAEITIEQLEELFYRVKEAQFTAGSAKHNRIIEDESEVVLVGEYTFFFSGQEATDRYIETGNFFDDTSVLQVYFSQRSYSFIQDPSRSESKENFFDYFKDSYTISSGSWNSGPTSYDYEVECYDVDDDESVMWIQGSCNYASKLNYHTMYIFFNSQDKPFHYIEPYEDSGYVTGFNSGILNETPIYDYFYGSFQEVVTGYSHFFMGSGANSAESTYYGFVATYDDEEGFSNNTGIIYLDLSFFKEVAWVDLDGSGNPFSPTNKIYLPVYFQADLDTELFNHLSSSLAYRNERGQFPNVDDAICNLILKMNSGEVVIPLYIDIYVDPDIGVEGGGGNYTFDGYPIDYEAEDFVIEAVEWWPYNGTWDADTGNRL